MEQKEQIKNFTLGFFKNLKCTLAWNGDVLEVSNVPSEFESFYGKKAPYFLVFETAAAQEQTELMARGSYLLRRMADFMGDRGQATLLRWDVDINPQEMLLKTTRLANSMLASYTKKREFRVLFRFTFATTFQYLNEREQMMNTVYVNDGKVIEADVPKEELMEGKKGEIAIEKTEEAYVQAKEYVRSLFATPAAKIKGLLREKLERERARIRAHYGQQLKEHEEELARTERLIAEHEGQRAKGTLKEGPASDAKIRRLRENLKLMRAENRKEKLKKEEEFFIRDEIAKHGLTITNKLINTTVIYYPVFTCTFFLTNAGAGRLLESSYHPLTKHLKPFACEVCRTSLAELWLCTSGHTLCKGCTATCPSCHRGACLSCLAKACEHCNRKACKKCLVRCTRCNKSICGHHRAESGALTGCICCLASCPFCSSLTPRDCMKSCPACKLSACVSCSRTQARRMAGSVACARCAHECMLCGVVRKKEFFPPCRECKFASCNHGNICTLCRKKLGVKIKNPNRSTSRTTGSRGD